MNILEKVNKEISDFKSKMAEEAAEARENCKVIRETYQADLAEDKIAKRAAELRGKYAKEHEELSQKLLNEAAEELRFAEEAELVSLKNQLDGPEFERVLALMDRATTAEEIIRLLEKVELKDGELRALILKKANSLEDEEEKSEAARYILENDRRSRAKRAQINANYFYRATEIDYHAFKTEKQRTEYNGITGVW